MHLTMQAKYKIYSSDHQIWQQGRGTELQLRKEAPRERGVYTVRHT
jgi:hypothetical protein